MDDIVFFSKSPANHIDQVWRVWWLLYETEVTLKLKKGRFLAEIIEYSRHVIHPVRLEMTERTKNNVAKLEIPTTQTELSSFPGLFNVVRRLVSSFARLAAPFNKTLRKDEPKLFGPVDKMKNATVTSLKEALIKVTVLALPRKKASTLLTPMLATINLGVYLFRSRNTEATALLASSFAL